MFIRRLSETFRIDEPIFSEEIIGLFPEYSRVQIFRYIEKAKKNKEIVQFSRGVYYLPHTTFWGTLSTITADSVIAKRYVSYQRGRYGVYSGIKLLNSFSVTTQMPAVIEIVTNNETMRRREIELNGRRFILRKSRTEITEENYAAYTVLQLFHDIDDGEVQSGSFQSRLLAYIREQKVTGEQLSDMASAFPAKAAKNMIRSGILYEIA